jgi:NDP-sugar pyrophosphorylase family protein
MALRGMRASLLRQPHASATGRLRALRKVIRMREMLVLAGGFGTRLRGVVAHVPKPLAPVVDRPFLYYLVDNWFQQGVRRLTFLLHHQAALIERFLEEKKSEGHWRECEIRTLTEPNPLGTGGAVGFAVQELGITDSFLVANADTWLGSGIQTLAGEMAPAIATIQVANTERYGSVQTDGERVIAFAEKQASAGAGRINAGLYNLPAGYFEDWDGRSFSLERDLFPVLVSNGELRAVHLETDFIDIGVPGDYFRFCRWIEANRIGSLCS